MKKLLLLCTIVLSTNSYADRLDDWLARGKNFEIDDIACFYDESTENSCV